MSLSGPEISASEQSLPGLVRQLVQQLSVLLRQELTLARTELHQSLLHVCAAGKIIILGAALLYAALLLLLAAIVLVLGVVIPLWLAALAVAVIIGASGWWIIERGRLQLSNTLQAPTHLPDSLRRDKDVLLRRTHP